MKNAPRRCATQELKFTPISDPKELLGTTQNAVEIWGIVWPARVSSNVPDRLKINSLRKTIYHPLLGWSWIHDRIIKAHFRVPSGSKYNSQEVIAATIVFALTDISLIRRRNAFLFEKAIVQEKMNDYKNHAMAYITLIRNPMIWMPITFLKRH